MKIKPILGLDFFGGVGFYIDISSNLSYSKLRKREPSKTERFKPIECAFSAFLFLI